MITRLLNARARLRANDDGIAIVMVIGISMVLMILVTVALGVSLSGMTKSKTDESWNAAITAAYAGIEDYKSKIANDNSYYRYGNTAAPFSSGSTLSAPPQLNVAFGTGATGTWATVPSDRTGQETAFYRYEVDSRSYLTSGILKVRATGRSGDVTRSIVANLKQKGFIDFLYYTDYEIGDPDLLTSLTATQRAACVKYAYAGRPSNCGPIAFGRFDVINGPMHTNDTFRACGSTFNGAVTTSYRPASGDAYIRGNASSTGCPTGQVESFPKGKPVSVGTLDLPPTNQKMFDEVRTDIPLDVPRPGCLYSGPTKVVFNSDGTMTVRSPWTKVTRVSNAAGTAGSTPAECGTPGVAAGQLGSAGGATITVPARNLVFVQDVKFVSGSVTALQPQWKSGTFPKRTSTIDYNATDCNNGNFLGYPIANEQVTAGVSTAYNCKKGDLFVEGTVNGEVSINADNYIYVTDDIQYAAASTDSVLGLIAQNQIWVWNPIKTNDTRFYGGDRFIDAAMLSVLKTFQVQNYNYDSGRGTLHVNGAIAQKFRGPVATGNSSSGALASGFSKDYNYDERFRYIAPPKFLSPVSTTYGITTVVEVKTAYKPDGSPF
ncbi:MAG: hypothetical protein ACOH1T_10900 [Microbacteriaceae bacterium]